MTVELTPELIAICVTFVGVVIASITITLKVGRWMERIDNRLENLEKGQGQILTALQNHIHPPEGMPPLFYTPVIQPHIPPTMAMPGDVPAVSGQAEPGA